MKDMNVIVLQYFTFYRAQAIIRATFSLRRKIPTHVTIYLTVWCVKIDNYNVRR